MPTRTCSCTPTATRRRASTPRSSSRPSARLDDEPVAAGRGADPHLEPAVREPGAVGNPAAVEPDGPDLRPTRKCVAQEQPRQRGAHPGGGPVGLPEARGGQVDGAAADADVLAADPR